MVSNLPVGGHHPGAWWYKSLTWGRQGCHRAAHGGYHGCTTVCSLCGSSLCLVWALIVSFVLQHLAPTVLKPINLYFAFKPDQSWVQLKLFFDCLVGFSFFSLHPDQGGWWYAPGQPPTLRASGRPLYLPVFSLHRKGPQESIDGDSSHNFFWELLGLKPPAGDVQECIHLATWLLAWLVGPVAELGNLWGVVVCSFPRP